METLKSINPSNYQLLGEVEVSSPGQVEQKVEAARVAQKFWGHLRLSERIHLLRNALDEFEERKMELARPVSREMGMPRNESLTVDYQGGADFAKSYFEQAEKYLTPEISDETETEISQVYHEPLGVAAVIIPWNYPFLNVVWSSFQSLIAGNAVVLKHSEECPLSAKFIEDVMRRHLPTGVFSAVYGDGKVGQVLVNQDVNLIHFVGSAKTGWSLYELAGKKRVPIVMELGGSAPGIIFEDADFEMAVKSVCDYRLGNAGQWCDGLKRLIVQEKIFVDVVERVAAIFASKRVGNAEEETTEIGPLAAKRQLDLLVSQVSDAKEKGASAVTGGNSLELEMNGAFHKPTALVNVVQDMKVWQEEVFGPVLPIVYFKTEEEAVALANDTQYGLGGYVYTKDKERAIRVAREIQSGMVSIGGANYTTPRNPFGGYKGSGIGREHGKWGFYAVTQTKVISMPK